VAGLAAVVWVAPALVRTQQRVGLGALVVPGWPVVPAPTVPLQAWVAAAVPPTEPVPTGTPAPGMQGMVPLRLTPMEAREAGVRPAGLAGPTARPLLVGTQQRPPTEQRLLLVGTEHRLARVGTEHRLAGMQRLRVQADQAAMVALLGMEGRVAGITRGQTLQCPPTPPRPHPPFSASPGVFVFCNYLVFCAMPARGWLVTALCLVARAATISVAQGVGGGVLSLPDSSLTSIALAGAPSATVALHPVESSLGSLSRWPAPNARAALGETVTFALAVSLPAPSTVPVSILLAVNASLGGVVHDTRVVDVGRCVAVVTSATEVGAWSLSLSPSSACTPSAAPADLQLNISVTVLLDARLFTFSQRNISVAATLWSEAWGAAAPSAVSYLFVSTPTLSPRFSAQTRTAAAYCYNGVWCCTV
jgi:hypothetical protein